MTQRALPRSPSTRWRPRHLRATLSCGLALLALAAAAGAAEPPAREKEKDKFPALEALEREVSLLVEQARPSVVGIIARSSIERMLQGLGDQIRIQPEQLAQVEALASRVGSGVILDDRGHIATVASAVAGARDLEVLLSDGSRLPATLTGVDDYSGLAVISVRTDRRLRPAPAGSPEAIRPGSLVAAFSRSTGDTAGYTLGFVSGRGVSRGPLRHGPYLKLDAYAAPGAGGGPVFDSRGRLVGILFGAGSPGDSARGPIAWTMRTPSPRPGAPVEDAGDEAESEDAEDPEDEEEGSPSAADMHLWYLKSLHREGTMGGGVSYAVPIEVVRAVTDQLIRSGSVARGWLGVTVESSSPGDVRLTRVVTGSPAATAGLREDDVLVSIDGRPVAEAEALVERIAGAPPGEVVSFVVRREGRSLPVRVTLGQRPEEPGPFERIPRSWSIAPPAWPAPPLRLGVTIDAPDDATRESLGGSAGIGLLIGEVVDESPAQRGGMREGDLLTHVGGEPVRSLSDLRRWLRRHDPGRPLQVKVVRNRRVVALAIPFEEVPQPAPMVPPPPPPPPAPEAGRLKRQPRPPTSD